MTTEETRAVSLVERVLVTTRERILNGTYAPGSRLRLHKIAEEAGVSLIPAREALRVLEAERLVITVPNKGARVAELSLEDMRDLYAVRSTLEAEAVRTARQLSTEEADHLRSMLDEIQDAFGAGDEAKVMRIHRQFHFGLYERSDSGSTPSATSGFPSPTATTAPMPSTAAWSLLLNEATTNRPQQPSRTTFTPRRCFLNRRTPRHRSCNPSSRLSTPDSGGQEVQDHVDRLVDLLDVMAVPAALEDGQSSAQRFCDISGAGTVGAHVEWSQDVLGPHHHERRRRDSGE